MYCSLFFNDTFIILVVSFIINLLYYDEKRTIDGRTISIMRSIMGSIYDISGD
jgi:hypothetical protein